MGCQPCVDLARYIYVETDTYVFVHGRFRLVDFYSELIAGRDKLDFYGIGKYFCVFPCVCLGDNRGRETAPVGIGPGDIYIAVVGFRFEGTAGRQGGGEPHFLFIFFGRDTTSCEDTRRSSNQ
jgi:hypothetical protein